MKASELFVDARDFERRGEYQKAYEAYKVSWKLDSTSSFLTNYLIELSLLAKQPGDALHYITKGKPLEELNDSTLRTIVGIYSRFQNYTQAIYVAEKIGTPTLQDSILFATLLEKGERYLEAASYIKTLQRTTQEDDSLPILKNLTEINITIKIATLLQKAEMNDSAITLFDSVLEKEPYNLAALRGIGMSLFSTNTNIERGRDCLQEVYDSTLKSGTPDIVSAELLAKYYAQSEKWDTALGLITPVFDSFKERGVDSYTLYYGKMIALYRILSGDVINAEALIDELITLSEGKDYEVLLYSGMLHTNRGDLEKAKYIYHQIISMNDTIVPAYRQLIGILVEEKKVDEAILIGKLFTEKVPDSVVSYSILGHLYTSKGDFTSAVPALEKAVELDPTSQGNRFELAMAYERSGNIASAVPIFEQLIAEDSTNAVVTNYLGYLWADQGIKLDEAERLIALALEVDSANGAYLDSYGWVYYKKRAYDKAEKYLLMALDKITDDYVIYYHLGDLYTMLEKFEKALTYYKKALEFKSEPDTYTIKRKIQEIEKVLDGSQKE